MLFHVICLCTTAIGFEFIFNVQHENIRLVKSHLLSYLSQLTTLVLVYIMNNQVLANDTADYPVDEDVDEDGRTLLHCAAKNGDIEGMKWFINRGTNVVENNAEVTAACNNGKTVLYYTAM